MNLYNNKNKFVYNNLNNKNFKQISGNLASNITKQSAVIVAAAVSNQHDSMIQKQQLKGNNNKIICPNDIFGLNNNNNKYLTQNQLDNHNNNNVNCNNSLLANNVNANNKTTNDLFTTEFEINDVRIAVRNVLTKVKKK